MFYLHIEFYLPLRLGRRGKSQEASENKATEQLCIFMFTKTVFHWCFSESLLFFHLGICFCSSKVLEAKASQFSICFTAKPIPWPKT